MRKVLKPGQKARDDKRWFHRLRWLIAGGLALLSDLYFFKFVLTYYIFGILVVCLWALR